MVLNNNKKNFLHNYGLYSDCLHFTFKENEFPPLPNPVYPIYKQPNQRKTYIHNSFYSVLVSKPYYPVNVNVSKPVYPVNVSKCVFPVDATKPVCPINVNKHVRPVSVSKPACPVTVSKPVCPVNVSKPVCPINVSKPVCPVNVSKPVCHVNVSTPVCKYSVSKHVCSSVSVSDTVVNINESVYCTPCYSRCDDSVVKSPIYSNSYFRPKCKLRKNVKRPSNLCNSSVGNVTQRIVSGNTPNIQIKYKRRNYLQSLLFISALFWEFMLLAILIYNNFYLSNNNYVYKNTNFLYKTPNISYNKHQFFLQTNYSNVFNIFFSFKPLHVFINFINLPNDIYYYLKIFDDIIKTHAESIFLLIFFVCFGMFFIEKTFFILQIKSRKREILSRGFLKNLFGIFNPFFSFTKYISKNFLIWSQFFKLLFLYV